MNSAGIDVSKGKSTVAVVGPFGEIVAAPYDVAHTAADLKKLTTYLKSLPGETRIVMEYTGRYYEPIAGYLQEAGFFISVVNPILLNNYSKSTIRKAKTDKKDALKIASYGIDRWDDLVEYSPEDKIRRMLKIYNRQYNQYMKLKVMLKNNLISLLDQTFPGLNSLFTSAPRDDGHEKWVDFAEKFWHCKIVSAFTAENFTAEYTTWCRQAGYHGSTTKAQEIYAVAQDAVETLEQSEESSRLIGTAVKQVLIISETIAEILKEMNRLASLLPEYPVVMSMYCVGKTCGPQLIAEIGDVRRFRRRESLVAFAGIDAPPYQSGTFDSQSRSISKRGSPALRKTLFQIMRSLLQKAPENDEVYRYLDKKRSEGKNYYVYMMAGANKFLRRYYSNVKKYFYSLDESGGSGCDPVGNGEKVQKAENTNK